jgi:uncharacterized 2Fe-2S/4Fe-4S cluster protein (DUF4445 family)
MTREPVQNFKVIFQPDGADVTVPKGITLLEACSRAGIAIDAVCGGEGKCGRCKVRPKGRFQSSPSPLVSKEEADAGVVLACLTTVEGDLSVDILPRARIGKHQILTKSVDEIPQDISPWVRKKYVELPPPTLTDNIGDLERLLRGIGRKGLCVPLDTIVGLPKVIREKNWKVTASVTDLEIAKEVTDVDPGDTSDHLLGVAVDIGTTTVVVDLVDLKTGKTLRTGSDYNRQTSRGEDVISRMIFAEERSVSELKLLVRETINLIISSLIKQEAAERKRPLKNADIVAASIAGNTIMIHMFAGIETRYIRLEPYVPASYNIPCLRASEVGLRINPAARVRLFPARAGYVGGDVVADVLASGMHMSDGLSMLIDVGTNGEIVLGGKDWMTACSCSAGPAFEGGEVSCGMRAMEGAIDKIRINDDWTTSYHVIGDGLPAGICGSGLIDLIAEMYTRGLIDRKARILEGDRVQMTDSGAQFLIERKKNMGEYARSDLVITDADLQNLLRTKAAIYGACSVLMKKSDVKWESISNLTIAGGFGSHLDLERAILMGMFPDIPREKYRFIGNGALGGARLALISAKKRKEVSSIFDRMTYIELSTDTQFYDEFSSSLFIPHTDLGRFPSHPAQTNHQRDAR